MKILVTGAAGFIGSYVSRALIWRGDDVVGLDNFNDYYPRKCKELNLDLVDAAAGNKIKNFDKETVDPIYEKLDEYYSGPRTDKKGKFKFYELDIVDYPSLKELFHNEKLDAVIHLAAMAGVTLSVKDPRRYSTVNVDGTVNILELSKDTGVQKIEFGSSSSVYGDMGGAVVGEEDDVTKAVSPYGASKVAGEVLCHSFSKVYDMDIVVNRIFGPIYGPLQRTYGMFMQRAINYVYNDKEIEIYGRKGLDSAKDSTYIDDQVDGILKCLDYDTDFEIFNIGTSDPQTIRTWISEIEKSFGKKLPYKIVEADKGDVASSADITKAKNMLGYEPKMKLSEGIRRQVEVFKILPEWYKTLKRV